MSEWLPMLGVIKTYASGLLRLCVPRPCRVLIVDDEPSVRRFAERVLSDAGFVTSSASDGPDALKKFEYSEPFDVLLTDVVMPQMSGDELARRIRLKQPSVKVLDITGHSDRLFKEKPRCGTMKRSWRSPARLTACLKGSRS
jgi:CheY-like chemotaxis protein